MRCKWKDNLQVDIASTEAKILQKVNETLSTFQDKHRKIRADMDMHLKYFHTMAQADLQDQVKSTVVEHLANDEVCRIAVDAGVKRQHVRVANAVCSHVLAHTLPRLQQELDTTVQENFRKAAAMLISLDERAAQCLTDLRSEIQTMDRLCTTQLDEIRALQENTSAADEEIHQLQATLEAIRGQEADTNKLIVDLDSGGKTVSVEVHQAKTLLDELRINVANFPKAEHLERLHTTYNETIKNVMQSESQLDGIKD